GAANRVNESREARRHRQRGARCKLGDRRTRQTFELTIWHSNRVAVRPTTEHDLRIAGECRIDHDPLSEQRPEWGHRAGLALAISRQELGLERQSHGARVYRALEAIKIDRAWSRHYRKKQ